MLGLQTGPVISHTGRSTGYGIQVELTPLGAFALLAMPLRHLADRMVPPADVLGRRWDAGLTEQLASAPNWGSRWAILDGVISSRLADSRCWPSPVACEAWSLLRASHGTLSVGQLAEATGRSRRRLEVLFAEQIGLAPKSVGRVLRFQRALTRLPKPGGTWAETAAVCGYHDQAHLARDFRALAGMTATGLQALATNGTSDNNRPFAGHLTSVLAS
ncbi:helix-turn-helix domain-containing protein [Streptomyces sp. NPDC005931]|uniref:helix-turn-helix domain-containing protein n=1 Tax=Streptomyces sp. NPDC005931 TaxID=3364737 RepID=UPI0036A04F7A